jgi:hypothetical protein
MKVSPEELRQFFKMQPASLLKVGEHFYMQLFENNTSDSFDFTPPQSPRKRGEAHMRHPFSHFPPFTGG